MVRKNQLIKTDQLKFFKKDNSWLAKLGEKRAKFLRKLVNGMKRFNEKEIQLPFEPAIISAEIIHRGNGVSWFHDNKADDCKLLLRVEGLDEEGIGMHLTEIAKVLQWILWVPLIGDPNTSKQAPDRVWRESTFTNPASFLVSYVNDSKVDVLEDLVADRWDAGMMLGGSDQVKNLIYKHISNDNEELKTTIIEWLRYLKWHQEFDWEEVSEYVLFGSTNPKLNIFWENEEYNKPESYTSNIVWTSENRNIADNIRKIVAEVPGFEDLKERLEQEALEEEEAKNSVNEDTAEAQSSTNAMSSCNSTTPPKVVFRPDMPCNGEKKVEFVSHFMRHTLWKNSPMTSWKKRLVSPFEMNVKPVEVKSGNQAKYSKSRKQVSRKKKVMKVKYKKKSGKKGRSTKKKSRRKY